MKQKIRIEDQLTHVQKNRFRAMVDRGDTLVAIAKEFGITSAAVVKVKERWLGIVPPQREKIVARERMKRPEFDYGHELKERKCLACGDSFMSEHYGNRNCGCNAYKSISDQMLYA